MIRLRDESYAEDLLEIHEAQGEREMTAADAALLIRGYISGAGAWLAHDLEDALRLAARALDELR